MMLPPSSAAQQPRMALRLARPRKVTTSAGRAIKTQASRRCVASYSSRSRRSRSRWMISIIIRPSVPPQSQAPTGRAASKCQDQPGYEQGCENDAPKQNVIDPAEQDDAERRSGR